MVQYYVSENHSHVNHKKLQIKSQKLKFEKKELFHLLI